MCIRDRVVFHALTQFLALAQKEAIQNREVGDLRKSAIKECAEKIRFLQKQNEQHKDVYKRQSLYFSSFSSTAGLPTIIPLMACSMPWACKFRKNQDRTISCISTSLVSISKILPFHWSNVGHKEVPSNSGNTSIHPPSSSPVTFPLPCITSYAIP